MLPLWNRRLYTSMAGKPICCSICASICGLRTFCLLLFVVVVVTFVVGSGGIVYFSELETAVAMYAPE